MLEVNLPHLKPLRFLKEIVDKNLDIAKTRVEFDSVPSLAMLVEAAAQSASALGDGKTKTAYLAALKNIKLLCPLNEKNFEIEVQNQHSLENMKLISFSVFEKKVTVASGSFTIAIESEN